MIIAVIATAESITLCGFVVANADPKSIDAATLKDETPAYLTLGLAAVAVIA